MTDSEILAILTGWSIKPRGRSRAGAPPASRAQVSCKVSTKRAGICTPKFAKTERWVNLTVKNTKAAS